MTVGNTGGLGADIGRCTYESAGANKDAGIISKIGPTEGCLIGAVVLGGVAFVSDRMAVKGAAVLASAALFVGGIISLGGELEAEEKASRDTYCA